MEGEKAEFLIVYYINEIKRKPEQRCSGLFVCKKNNCTIQRCGKRGENERNLSTKHERRCDQKMFILQE